MITFRLKSSVWSFICLCVMSVDVQSTLHFHNAIVVFVFHIHLLFFYFYRSANVYIKHGQLKNYGWLCLLFSYGDTLDNIIHLTLMTLSGFILRICLDSPWSAFGFWFHFFLVFCYILFVWMNVRNKNENHWTNDDIFSFFYTFVIRIWDTPNHTHKTENFLRFTNCRLIVHMHTYWLDTTKVEYFVLNEISFRLVLMVTSIM